VNSPKFAARQHPHATTKMGRLGDIPERAVLVGYLPTAVRGSEPCPYETEHLGARVGTWGRGKPVVRPATARPKKGKVARR
jgi:hypothetical protein